jgi:hypothetical protein
MLRHNQIASFLRKIRVLKITKHLRYEFNKNPCIRQAFRINLSNTYQQYKLKLLTDKLYIFFLE